MNLYRLSRFALDDLDSILSDAAEARGWEASMRIEEALFAGLERLARSPGIGHRRADLSSGREYFYNVEMFLIVHDRQPAPLPILAILHSSRDVRSVLQERR